MMSLFWCFFCVGMAYHVWEMAGGAFLLLSLISLCLFNQNWSVSQDMLYMWSNWVSVLLVFLTCMLCFLCWVTTPYMRMAAYMVNIFLLGIFLSYCFSVPNMILFYMCFEISLVPTLILIIGFGYQPERLQAGTYMMLYTVGASLPLFLAMIWWCNETNTMSMLLQKSWISSVPMSLLAILYGAFLVKLPMYSTHLWLPKAHVEAPLVGSMMLAGILLKLGGYGIFLMNMTFTLSVNMLSVFLVSLSMWGGLLVSFLCLRQVDVKALVAYSSVGHMGIVSSGLILDSTWGVTSAVITMLAHGMSSSALFCLAFFTYMKSHTRNMPFMKGLLQAYPILSFWWFLYCCINMAAPPTLNLVGELLVSVILWKSSWLLAVIMGLMVFFSAAYNMYLYCSINHGFYSNYTCGGTTLLAYENTSLLIHLLPLLLLLKGSVLLFLEKVYLWITKSMLY